MADNATTESRKMPVKNVYWLALAVAGVLMALPLSWLSFGLLLFIPGLSAYTLIRKRYNLVELVMLSFTLSLVLFALTTLVTMAMGVHGAPRGTRRVRCHCLVIPVLETH